MFHIYGLYHISIYIRSAFYVFSVRKGRGAVNFGSLLSFIIDMTSISSVETPVDRRRVVFSSVFVAY